MYGSSNEHSTRDIVCRAHVLRDPSGSITLWPGEFIELELPDDIMAHDNRFALEPRTDAPSTKLLKPSQVWPPPDIVS